MITGGASVILVGLGILIGVVVCRKRTRTPIHVDESPDDFTTPSYVSAQRIEPRVRYSTIDRRRSQRTSLYIEETRNGKSLHDWFFFFVQNTKTFFSSFSFWTIANLPPIPGSRYHCHHTRPKISPSCWIVNCYVSQAKRLFASPLSFHREGCSNLYDDGTLAPLEKSFTFHYRRGDTRSHTRSSLARGEAPWMVLGSSGKSHRGDAYRVPDQSYDQRKDVRHSGKTS